MYIDIIYIYIWYTDVYGIGCDQNWVPQQWPQWPSSDQKKVEPLLDDLEETPGKNAKSSRPVNLQAT